MSVSAPVLTVIAGPNGVGKSTLTASLTVAQGTPILDPDAIARSLNPQAPETGATWAGRVVLNRQNAYLRSGTSFILETTLAGSAVLRLMDEARRRGFRIHLIYIGVDDVQVLLARIAGRVLDGGHAVPEHDVRRRYVRSMRHMKEAIARADNVTLLDNVLDQEPQLVMTIDDGRSTIHIENLPSWVTSFVVR